MTVVVYPAHVSAAEGGGLIARFPDFAELNCTAANPADLVLTAREALARELQRREAQGEDWPPASDALAPEPGASLLLVDVTVDDTPVRVTISLGERLLRRIDGDAEARSMTRSGYLALGARRLLEQASSEPGAARNLQEEIAGLARRVNDTLGPDSPIGRTLAELDGFAMDGLRRVGSEMRSAMSPRSRRGAAQAAPEPEPQPQPHPEPAAPEAADGER